MRTVGFLLLVGCVYVAVLGVVWLGQSGPAGSLFAMNTVQTWWYVTRAAGLTGYVLLWLSMVWGMAISTRILAPAVEGTYSYDFHEFLSLIALGFVVLHVVVLLLDRYLPFSLLQVLVPFVDTYRPLWVGLGVIGFYILTLVTITFYIRQSIGMRAFRAVHILSLIGYLGATLHGLFAGTDSALPAARLIYAASFLVVVFLTAYWLVMRALTTRSDGIPVPATTREIRRGPARRS